MTSTIASITPQNNSALWGFIATELIGVIAASVLALITYRVYSQTGARQYLIATVGFGCLLCGGVVEPVYQFGFREFVLSGNELLAIQTLEGILMAVGFILLFYSIYSFSPPEQERSDHSVHLEFDESKDEPDW